MTNSSQENDSFTILKDKSPNGEERLKILSNVNRYLRKRMFAHHPDCDQYDRHTFNIRGFIVCVGDAGVYSAILLILLWHRYGPGKNWHISSLTLFGLGMLFFIPAIIQLFWKSRRKLIKFFMRFSLGISIFYLLSFTFSFSSYYWVLFYLMIFITGTLVYSLNNSKKHHYECKNCPYGEIYASCLRRNMGLLKIEGIEKIQDISPSITNIISIRNQRKDEFEQLKIEN